jgi:hypothetical protein
MKNPTLSLERFSLSSALSHSLDIYKRSMNDHFESASRAAMLLAKTSNEIDGNPNSSTSSTTSSSSSTTSSTTSASVVPSTLNWALMGQITASHGLAGPSSIHHLSLSFNIPPLMLFNNNNSSSSSTSISRLLDSTLGFGNTAYLSGLSLSKISLETPSSYYTTSPLSSSTTTRVLPVPPPNVTPPMPPTSTNTLASLGEGEVVENAAAELEEGMSVTSRQQMIDSAMLPNVIDDTPPPIIVQPYNLESKLLFTSRYGRDTLKKPDVLPCDQSRQTVIPIGFNDDSLIGPGLVSGHILELTAGVDQSEFIRLLSEVRYNYANIVVKVAAPHGANNNNNHNNHNHSSSNSGRYMSPQQREMNDMAHFELVTLLLHVYIYIYELMYVLTYIYMHKNLTFEIIYICL